MSDKLLTPAEVGERTGYTPGGLAVMRHRKEGPPFVQHRPRGRVMYREEDVDAWIAAAVKTPASHFHPASVIGRARFRDPA